MPPRNKKPKPNGFIEFTSEWKKRNAPVNWTFQKCITEAGKVWDRMNAADRQPYHERAKAKSQTTVSTSPKTQQRKEQSKRNCVGDLVADVERRCKEAEKQQIAMNRTIDNTIRSAVHEYNLEGTQFYFIMVNYFTKSLDGLVYIPAELAIAEFSLEAGVSRVYHTHVNPGVTAFGQLYQTQQHAESTHKLPLPPNALGETDLPKINLDILKFLRHRDESRTTDLPPLYTTKENMPIVKSALNLMKNFDDPDLRIFSIEYLFYALKDQTCKICGIESPKSQIITNAYFERDSFEYLAGFSCKYHEDIDCTKYCAESYVTRWGYTFADYMCPDLAIPLQPGRHKPKETKPNFIIIDPDNKETCSNRREDSNIELERQPLNDNYKYKPSPSRYNENEDPHQSMPAFVKNERKIDMEPDTFVEQNVADYQYPYETRSSSSSPSSSRAPSPPPPPQNLDFGYCDTSKRLSPLFNQLLSASGKRSSSPSVRLNRTPSLERQLSEPIQQYSPHRDIRLNSPNRRGYRISPQRSFESPLNSPSRRRRSLSRQRSSGRHRRSSSRQRRSASRERRIRRAPDHRRSPPYRSIGRRTPSPFQRSVSRDRRRSPAHRNRSPPRRRRSSQHSRSPLRNHSPNHRSSWQRTRRSPSRNRSPLDNENYRFRESPPASRRQRYNERFDGRMCNSRENTPIAEREFRRSLSMEGQQYRRPSPPPSPSQYPRPQMAPYDNECAQPQTFNYGPNMNVPIQQPPYFAQGQTNWQPNMPPMQFNNNIPNGMLQDPSQFPAPNMPVQHFPPAQDLREFLQNRNPKIFMSNDSGGVPPPPLPPPLMAQQLTESDLRYRLQARDMNFRGGPQPMPGNVGMPQHLLGASGGNGDNNGHINPYTQQLGGSGRGEVLAQLRRGFGPGISDDYNRSGFNY